MVYVTSDLHGAFDIHKINPDEFIPGRSMGKDDFLVICGDFGCIWDGGRSDAFWLNWLESLPWTTLFIDGNHENFDVLNTYPEEDWNGGQVRRIRSNVLYLKRGESFHFANKTWLALGGGLSHDVMLREQGQNWWQEEIFSQEEAKRAVKTLEAEDWKVDVILSHDVYASHPLAGKYETDMNLYGTDRVNQHEFLEMIRKKTDYRLWICGHYHQDLLTEQDGKPCWMLFDKVEEIDQLIEQAENR